MKRGKGEVNRVRPVGSYESSCVYMGVCVCVCVVVVVVVVCVHLCVFVSVYHV